MKRVYTKAEIAHCNTNPLLAPARFAGRFAAKEAALKALGLGLAGPEGVGVLRAVEVVRRPSGQPALRLAGWPARMASRRRVQQTTVSLSHAAGVAMASVVMVADEPSEEE
jgi:holo-[acyl-carrier protein] synthase